MCNIGIQNAVSVYNMCVQSWQLYIKYDEVFHLDITSYHKGWDVGDIFGQENPNPHDTYTLLYCVTTSVDCLPVMCVQVGCVSLHVH